jgi:hypothetical protein
MAFHKQHEDFLCSNISYSDFYITTQSVPHLIRIKCKFWVKKSLEFLKPPAVSYSYFAIWRQKATYNCSFVKGLNFRNSVSQYELYILSTHTKEPKDVTTSLGLLLVKP